MRCLRWQFDFIASIKVIIFLIAFMSFDLPLDLKLELS